MAVVARLVNPTPFDVKIPYERGVYINIPSDGDVELSMGQLDDFRPGKPGSEAARKLLDFEGVFLQDTDLSYDLQALRALQVAVKERKDRIKTFTERTRNSRIAGGATVDDATMEDLIQNSGYGRMINDVEKMVKRIETLQVVVGADTTHGAVRQNLDPRRTIFCINPPRQFPSETAMAMYLTEHPDVAAEHAAMTADDDAPVPVKEEV
jgi:hypothetical protein